MFVTDGEKLDLKTIMLVEGHKCYDTDYFDSENYKKLRRIMLENLPYGDMRRFHFDLNPKSEVIDTGRYVIDKHFGNLDLRVRFANGDDMESRLVAIFGLNPKPKKYDDIIHYINNQIELVRVTDIPVYLKTDNDSDGYVSTTYFYGNRIMKEEYFKKLPDCVREIGLVGSCNEDTKCVYVHEMAHALINRHKGSRQNLLNDEAFSIFMEKVAAKDIDSSGQLLDLKSLKRILQVKHDILNMELKMFEESSFRQVLECKKYIVSALHATALFDTYSKGSKKIRREIDSSLGKVIMGEDTIEDVFDYYEASLDRGTKVMKRQIKNYHSKINKA